MNKYFQCSKPVLVAISSKPWRNSPIAGSNPNNKSYPNSSDNIATKGKTVVYHKTYECIKREKPHNSLRIY